MGHSQARHFLSTLLRALSTHDYESVEQLRRTLAVERYRKVVNTGGDLDEMEVVPRTADVERWLAKLDGTQTGLLSEVASLLKMLEENDLKPKDRD